jgi:hypothetical protein
MISAMSEPCSIGRPLRRLALGASLVAGALGCGGDDASFTRSCRGEVVLDCDPHTYSIAREAALTPEGIGPSDPGGNAHVHAAIETCPSRPSRVELQLEALVPRTGAGEGAIRVIDLGVTVSDDGTDGDAVADDGVIDADIANPFHGEIPAEAVIRLRFRPVIAGCSGDAIEVEYTTGEAYVPPA